MEKKTLLIVSSGGTFQASADKRTATASYQCGTQSIEDIIHDTPELHEIANIEHLVLMNVASPDLTPKDMLQICQALSKRLADDKRLVDGVLFIGGTDLLALISFLFEITIQPLTGVALLGASLPLTSYGADGRKNLMCGARLVLTTSGVYLVSDNKIYQPRYTIKNDASSLCPFHSHAGPLGIFKDSKPIPFNHLPPKPVIGRYFDVQGLETLPVVNILPYYPGVSHELFYKTIEGAEGLVLQGVGSGGFSKDLGKKITEHAERFQFPVIMSSITFAFTEVEDAYGIGPPCIGSGFLDPYKSQIQLQLALAEKHDLPAIKLMFEGK